MLQFQQKITAAQDVVLVHAGIGLDRRIDLFVRPGRPDHDLAVEKKIIRRRIGTVGINNP